MIKDISLYRNIPEPAPLIDQIALVLVNPLASVEMLLQEVKRLTLSDDYE